MFSHETFTTNIKKYRKKQNISQNELATRLGLRAQSVSKWECGLAVPDIENLCALAEILNVSVDTLLGVTNEVKGQKNMIAIDGGGSKTEFVLFTETGKIINHLVLDGCNPNVYGIEKCCSILKMGIDCCLSFGKVASGIFVGSAGMGNQKNNQKVTSFLKSNYPDAKIECKSDYVNVIGSVPSVKNCVVAISGTGIVVSAYENGSLNSMGGWGYLLDTGGSGYDIGKDALRASLAESEKFGEKTVISSLIREIIGGDIKENIDKIYSSGTKFIASFAKTVFTAYLNGDKIAGEILERNARCIANLINAALKEYNCDNSVVISGSLVTKTDIYLNMIKKYVIPNVRIIVPNAPQIFGSCIMCCRLCGVSTKKTEENFADEYKKF